MLVTALKQQLKRPERISVFVDGKYSFSLSLDELARHKLKNGDQISGLDVKKFRKISADGKLRARTLEWLINRPHSERELRNYLYRKKVEPEQIEALTDEFTKKGHLNNAKFAEWFGDLQARRGKSNRAIKTELLSKGIDIEMIDGVLGQAEDEARRLRALIAKKQNLSRYKNDQLKFIKYLTSQGFSYSLVKSEIKNIQTEN